MVPDTICQDHQHSVNSASYGLFDIFWESSMSKSPRNGLVLATLHLGSRRGFLWNYQVSDYWSHSFESVSSALRRLYVGGMKIPKIGLSISFMDTG